MKVDYNITITTDLHQSQQRQRSEENEQGKFYTNFMRDPSVEIATANSVVNGSSSFNGPLRCVLFLRGSVFGDLCIISLNHVRCPFKELPSQMEEIMNYRSIHSRENALC